MGAVSSTVEEIREHLSEVARLCRFEGFARLYEKGVGYVVIMTFAGEDECVMKSVMDDFVAMDSERENDAQMEAEAMEAEDCDDGEAE
jgi:hypothetical protein